MKKENKKKPSYSLRGNLSFVLRNLWDCNKKDTIAVFFRAPLLVLVSYLGVWMSRAVVNTVAGGEAPEKILLTVGIFTLLTGLAVAAERFCEASMQSLMLTADFRVENKILEKALTCDYENMESAEGKIRVSKALEQCGSGNSGSRLVSSVLCSFCSNLIGIISYGILLCALSPWILLALTVTTLAGFWILKRTADWNYRNKDRWKGFDRKLSYLVTSAVDFTKAKDIRLYGMGEWLDQLFRDTLSGRMGWQKREQLYSFQGDGLRALLSLLRDLAAYGLLVWLLFAKGMTAADFIYYFGVVGGFAVWLSGFVSDWGSLHRFHLGFSELREFLDYPDRSNQGQGIPLPKDSFSIEFQNVCYRHGGREEDTIHNLSFTIAKGEKLALVGRNGAGKTTLVKLLCGLYEPDSGRILIDGKPLQDYNRKELFTLYAAVFQDIFLLPDSLRKNVTAGDPQWDEEKFRRSLALAGLEEKVRQMPQGAETKLVRSVYDDAVDLSGGELQKLALARALYKGGKALILDEPTAALDPIAESRIYQEYNRMSQGHTALFVSHRLASTRFCDRILFLEDGQIAESGSHEELMAKQGKYYQMFELQSHYYKKGVREDDLPGEMEAEPQGI